jgi:hypothetical protein
MNIFEFAETYRAIKAAEATDEKKKKDAPPLQKERDPAAKQGTGSLGKLLALGSALISAAVVARGYAEVYQKYKERRQAGK